MIMALDIGANKGTRVGMVMIFNIHLSLMMFRFMVMGDFYIILAIIVFMGMLFLQLWISFSRLIIINGYFFMLIFFNLRVMLVVMMAFVPVSVSVCLSV